MDGEGRKVGKYLDEIEGLRQELNELNGLNTTYLREMKNVKAFEALYKPLFENNPHPMWVYDMETLAFLAVNNAAVVQYGYSFDEFLSMTIKEIRPPEDVSALVERTSRDKEGLDQAGIWTHLKKDGTVIDAEITSHTLTFEERRAELVIAYNVTAGKRTEEALRESEEKFRTVTEKSPNMIFINKGGKVVYCNKMCEGVMGYTVDEISSPEFNFLDLVAPESRELVKKNFNRHMAGEEVDPYEYCLTIKDGGKIDVIITTKLIPYEGEKAILGIVTDITERKRLEAQLLQAQKMEAMGTLAGGIAHDFNNLLMGIQGRISLILEDCDPSHPFFENLSGIEEYVKNATALTKQLLGFARGGKYEVKPTNLHEILERTSRMFGRTKKEIKIYRKYQHEILKVEVDQGQIEQMLLNLFVNAWQAMPGGGELHLQTENVVLDESYVKPFKVEPGHYVKISVADTGVGMDDATRQRIFDPFFTTKELGRGTGLGLASVYGIVKNHGGIIDVRSKKDEGTTFYIYLPSSEKAITEREKLPAKMLKGAETILLVDDEDIIINVGKAMLKSLGYEVLSAWGGKKALEVYQENKDGIDMVILDMVMPDLNGGEVYDRFKEANPGVKVLLSSGYSIDGEAKEILGRGCNGFIQKPFNMTHLSQKIREILDKD